MFLSFIKAVDLYDSNLDSFVDTIIFFTCVAVVMASLINLALDLKKMNLTSVISLTIYIQVYLGGLVISGLLVKWLKLLVNK